MGLSQERTLRRALFAADNGRRPLLKSVFDRVTSTLGSHAAAFKRPRSLAALNPNLPQAVQTADLRTLPVSIPSPIFPAVLLTLATFAASAPAQGPSSIDPGVSAPGATAPGTGFALPGQPAAVASGAASKWRYPGATTTGFIPSRTLGVTLKLSSGGIGVDFTEPIAPRFAVRAGASFLSVNGSLVDKNIHVDGTIKLQNVFAGIDFFPFHSSFRITPGFSVASRATASAILNIPGGQTFSFGDGEDSSSDPADPVHGTARFGFGHGVSPRLTMGFANAIPHRNQHFSFPLEVGAEYIAPPTVQLNITGSGCQVDRGTTELDCGPVDQPDVEEERRELLDDLRPLRVFPVLSIGVTYWFGHVRSRY
jgi:hypothetical protein